MRKRHILSLSVSISLLLSAGHTLANKNHKESTEPSYKKGSTTEYYADRPVTPSVPASKAKAYVKGATSATFFWTNGDGQRRLIVLKQADNPQDFLPKEDSIYATSASLQEMDSATGNYLVYDGEKRYTFVENLMADTEYRIAIYEYNTDSLGNASYRINGRPIAKFRTDGPGDCRGIYLYSQKQVRAFGKRGCTTVKGDLNIGLKNGMASNIKSLRPLSNIKEIDNLYIGNMKAGSLKGLEGLKKIQNLEIRRNFHLKTLKGLNNVSEIKHMQVYNQMGLKSLKGMSSVKKLHKLTMNKVYGLKTMEGFDSLESVGDVILYYNPSLYDCCPLNNMPINGRIYTFSNKRGCNSVEEIKNGCLPPPLINDFSPKDGGIGTTVTLTGLFSNIQSVKFGEREAVRFTLLNDSTMTAMVPPGLTGPAPIIVQNYDGSKDSTQVPFSTIIGEPAEPTQPARHLGQDKIFNNGAGLIWKNGNGIRRLVVIKRADNPRDFLPEDGQVYRTSPSMKVVDPTTQNYLVYQNKNPFVSITGLEANTKYIYRVFEYHADNQGAVNYLTSSYPEAVFTTLEALQFSENPLYTTTDVRLPGADGTTTLYINNSRGEMVTKKPFTEEGTVTLDRAELNPGTYILNAYREGWVIVGRGKLVVR